MTDELTWLRGQEQQIKDTYRQYGALQPEHVDGLLIAINHRICRLLDAQQEERTKAKEQCDVHAMGVGRCVLNIGHDSPHAFTATDMDRLNEMIAHDMPGYRAVDDTVMTPKLRRIIAVPKRLREKWFPEGEPQ